MTACSVQSFLQQRNVRDTRNLHRVLESQEYPLARTILRRHRQQVISHERNRPIGDLIVVTPRDDIGQRALARAIRPHDGMYFSRTYLQVEAIQNGFSINRHFQIAYF